MGRGAIKIYDNLKQRVTCCFPWENHVNTPFCLHSSNIVRGITSFLGFTLAGHAWRSNLKFHADARVSRKNYMNKYSESRQLLK